MQPQERVSEYRVELGGHETRVLEVAGDSSTNGSGPDAPPLVMLHGFSDSADTWLPMLERLAGHGRRAIALDLPGFGAASRLDRERGVLEQLDEFAAAAIRWEAQRTGVEPVVIGNSMGGCVALRAAADRDLPLAGIVPVSPAGLDHPRWFQAIETAPLVRWVLRAPLLPELVVRQAVGRAYRVLAFHRQDTIDPAYVERFTSHIRSRRDVIRVLATGRRLLPELRDPFMLERIERPVLLVWGERDRMVSVGGAERVAAGVPHTKIEILEDVGHCPQLEAPDRVIELIESFASLDSVAAGA